MLGIKILNKESNFNLNIDKLQEKFNEMQTTNGNLKRTNRARVRDVLGKR